MDNAEGLEDFGSADGFGGVEALVVVATDALGVATGFACAAGDGVAGVVVCADGGAIGFFVSACTAAAFVCIDELAVVATDALGVATGFACAAAGDIVGVGVFTGADVADWAGDGTVVIFGSVGVVGDGALASDAIGSSDSFDSATGFGGMVALAVVATDALGVATGFACTAAGDIVGVGIFGVAGIDVWASDGAVVGFGSVGVVGDED